MRSMSKRQGGKSIAASIASLPSAERRDLIDGLSPNAVAALPFLFEVWGNPDHQLPPPGDWTTWLILGGRGAGKTRAGAEWVRSRVEGPTPEAPGVCARVALVGASLDEVRDVMVLGDSGLIACSPPDRRPVWKAERRLLEWPNGARAMCFAASAPEKLRGPQFDCAWCDELGKWRNARATWDMLQFALRLGERPQQVVTTTPRALKLLEELIEAPSTVTVSAPTWANAPNLAESFLLEVRRLYSGTSQAEEELEGRMVLDRDGALWTRALIERGRVKAAPELARIVVAVDPPATAGETADECGIVVAGVDAGGAGVRRAYVLADLSTQGESPTQWIGRVAAAYEDFRADRIVAEVNQGGDLVESLLRQAAPDASYRPVRATRGKTLRAEPVSALYERGLVSHVGVLPELEDQMRAFGAPGGGSPDRVDALVWALTELMLTEAPKARVRSL